MNLASVALIIESVGELIARLIESPDGLSDEEIAQEIKSIRQWAKDAEARERALFPGG